MNTMEQAMQAMNDPDVMQQAVQMMKDPKFAQEMNAYMKDPQMKKYMEAVSTEQLSVAYVLYTYFDFIYSNTFVQFYYIHCIK